jgi:hypothetical protein|tara:strand:+ start:1649 stop:3715 length:2067 start_codon:yes stop_codon:yes gene_type:complete
MRLAEEYAERKGYILDEELKMEHFGSAFTSRHTKEGDFAKFLVLVEKGEIEKGSILVVENLDRISRDKPMKALSLWLNILEQGIDIVSLEPREKHFNAETSKAEDISYALGQFDLANQESLKKSERIKDVWSEKRKEPNVEEGKFKIVKFESKSGIEKEKIGVPSRKCPSWLKFNDETRKFEIKSLDHSKTLKLIFDMAERKKGKMSIVQHLNENNVESFSGKAWHRSYIFAILTNRAVIGEKQFTKAVRSEKRKSPVRIPVGNPVRNYYPKVITHEQFETVQEIIESRKIGKYETKSINWLSGITSCFYTGTTMQKKWAGDNEYLISRAAADKVKGYVSGNLRLDETEAWILKSLHSFEFESVLQSKRNRRLEEERERLAELRTTIRARKGGLTRMSDDLDEAYMEDKPKTMVDALQKRMATTANQIEKFELDAAKSEEKIRDIQRSNNQVGDFFNSLKQMKAKLGKPEQRALFNNQLKRQVDSIELAIWGVEWDKKHYDNQFRQLCKSVGAEEITTDSFENLNKKTFEKNPLFLIYWFQQLAHELVKECQRNPIPESGFSDLILTQEIVDALNGDKFFLRKPSQSRSNIFIKIKFKNTLHAIWAKPIWIDKRGGRGLLLAANSKIEHTLYIDDLRRISFGDPSLKEETESYSFDYPDPDFHPYYPKEQYEGVMPTGSEEIRPKPRS